MAHNKETKNWEYQIKRNRAMPPLTVFELSVETQKQIIKDWYYKKKNKD